MSHPAFTLLAAALIATGVALTGNRPWRQRIHHATYMFAACILAVIVGGWTMHFIHG